MKSKNIIAKATIWTFGSLAGLGLGTLSWWGAHASFSRNVEMIHEGNGMKGAVAEAKDDFINGGEGKYKEWSWDYDEWTHKVADFGEELNYEDLRNHLYVKNPGGLFRPNGYSMARVFLMDDWRPEHRNLKVKSAQLLAGGYAGILPTTILAVALTIGGVVIPFGLPYMLIG